MRTLVAIGLSLAASTLGQACAQDRSHQSPPHTNAVVDASGRVTPVEQVSANNPSARAKPCGAVKPMAIEDARALVTRVATDERFFPDFVFSVAKAESHFDSIAVSDKG